MADALTSLRRELAQISDLQVASRVLEWDQLVMMPRGGAATRGDHLATVDRLAHELFVRDEIGELLERAAPEVSGLDPDSDDACLVAVARRDWEKARRIPGELRAEMTKLSSEGVEAWAAAREQDDFASFQPWLDRTLELKHRYIECFPATDDPYDPLLDDFEQGLPTSEVRRVFDRLEPALQELAAESLEDEPEPYVSGPYPQAVQHELSLVVARAFGADEIRSGSIRRSIPSASRSPPRTCASRRGTRRTTSTGRRSSPRCTRSGTASTSTAATPHSTGRPSRRAARRRSTSRRAGCGRT